MRSFLKWATLGTALLIGGLSFESYEPRDSRVTVTAVLPDAQVQSGFSDLELRCLARVVFNESRNQNFTGQVAVAAVVINRSLSAKFKQYDLCEVSAAPRQFAFHEPRLHNEIERRAMQTAIEVARFTASNYGRLPNDYRLYLFFHSGKAPGRAGTRIGDHTFRVSYSS